MKSFPLLPALLLGAPLLHANHRTIEDVGGTVAPLTINLVVSESTGGYLLNDAKKAAEEAKGVTYPALTTYTTTYLPDATASALLNPFWWDSTKGNNFVERVTTKDADTPSPVVTATGIYKTVSARYTNATLLGDLAATGRIPSVAGYRIVAVNFELDDEVHYYNGTTTTHVNGRLYFFAENNANASAPLVFLGSEYDDLYLYTKVVGFRRSTTIKSGKYTDTFTGRPDGSGYDYKLASQSFSGRTAADISFFRPTGGSNLYQIRVGGIFNWQESYNTRKEMITGGGFSGASLAGPAQGVFVVDANDPGTPVPPEGEAGHDDAPHDHGHVYDYIPNGGNPGIATGSVKTGSETHYESMLKYLNGIPEVRPH